VRSRYATSTLVICSRNTGIVYSGIEFEEGRDNLRLAARDDFISSRAVIREDAGISDPADLDRGENAGVSCTDYARREGRRKSRRPQGHT